MPLNCPACGKASETQINRACVRCGCDLNALHAVLESAARQLGIAAAKLRRQDWRSARVHAERSWELRKSVLAARIAFLAATAEGETRRAATWHARAQGPIPTAPTR